MSTRSASARGGYGKSSSTTELRTRFIERNALILNKSPVAYRQWRQLLVQHQIQGLADDARLVSMMQVAGISQILTLNTSDFRRYSGIVLVTPKDLPAQLQRDQ